MFSEEDLDKDLFLSQIYCVWIHFGSVSALSPICTQNFFFAVWAQQESTLLCSHSDIFDSHQKQDLTSSCLELNICCVFLPFSLQLPPVPILSPPSAFLCTNILLDSFRFSIYAWAHNEGHCCNGSHQEIAAVALWLGCCQLWGCLHGAPHHVFAGWCLCFVIPRFIITHSLRRAEAADVAKGRTP